jgi:GDP-D-mannose dehydratase
MFYYFNIVAFLLNPYLHISRPNMLKKYNWSHCSQIIFNHETRNKQTIAVSHKAKLKIVQKNIMLIR